VWVLRDGSAGTLAAIVAGMSEPRRSLPLPRVLASRVPAVIDHLRARWNVDAQAVAAPWTESLRWLWTCARYPERSLTITASLTILDDAWHELVDRLRSTAAGADGGAPGPEVIADPTVPAPRRVGPEVAASRPDGMSTRHPATPVVTRPLRSRR
jgi:hypothetical protein